MTHTDEQIETVAKAMRNKTHPGEWSRLPEEVREGWRRDARAALEAVDDTTRVTPALRVALRNLSRALAEVTKEIDNA